VDAYNADDWGNIVLDWDLNVSGGDENTSPAFSYTPATSPDVSVFDTVVAGFSIQFWVDTFAPGGTPESRVIVLSSEAPLTNDGGSVALYVNANDPMWQSRECYNCNPYRTIVSGSLSAVPVPAAFWLFGSGLISLISIARRKRT
jgi:hypothetical protein